MKITIYSTPTCPYCQLAKDFFKGRKIEFEEKNVALDQAAGEAMIKKTGQTGVPVIEMDDFVVVGFNRPEIEKILKEKK